MVVSWPDLHGRATNRYATEFPPFFPEHLLFHGLINRITNENLILIVAFHEAAIFHDMIMHRTFVVELQALGTT